jgi:hypothetical protein
VKSPTDALLPEALNRRSAEDQAQTEKKQREAGGEAKRRSFRCVKPQITLCSQPTTAPPRNLQKTEKILYI